MPATRLQPRGGRLQENTAAKHDRTGVGNHQKKRHAATRPLTGQVRRHPARARRRHATGPEYQVPPRRHWPAPRMACSVPQGWPCVPPNNRPERRISRDGRGQRSSRCATSPPEGERTERRIFAPLRGRAPSPHGIQISPFGAALSAARSRAVPTAAGSCGSLAITNAPAVSGGAQRGHGNRHSAVLMDDPHNGAVAAGAAPGFESTRSTLFASTQASFSSVAPNSAP